jgi:RNA polymerase sigma factor (sigma-70 family)
VSALASRLALIDALHQLPPRQRAVLVLRFFDDLTEADTAKLLGISPGTVKSTTSRGLARLREIVPSLREESHP